MTGTEAEAGKAFQYFAERTDNAKLIHLTRLGHSVGLPSLKVPEQQWQIRSCFLP